MLFFPAPYFFHIYRIYPFNRGICYIYFSVILDCEQCENWIYFIVYLSPQWFHTIQFSSVTQSCPTLCDPIDCSTPGLPVHHQYSELAQTHIHQVGDAIQLSHPLSSPSPAAFSLFQHQGLFQWVTYSHQVAKVLELQLQRHSFQWIFRTDFL